MQNLKVFENGLVPVYITDTGEHVVDGRELWGKLESKQEFSNWVKNRISECDANENIDFSTFDKFIERENSNLKSKRIEYIIKLDTAKEMAMLERNEIGKKVRKYFIEVEKRFKMNTSELSPQMQLLTQMVTSMAHQERQIKNATAIATEAKQTADSIRDIVALNPNDWRKDSSSIINRIAMKLGDNGHIRTIREESYRLLNERMGVSIETRLTNKRRRMADEGVCKSTRDKTNLLDVIGEDKKLIEGYVAIIKDLAIKYGVGALGQAQ